MKEFKIVRILDGKVMMQTEHESCVYSDDVIVGMMKAGYKAYKDGKVYKPGLSNRKEKKGEHKNGKNRRQSEEDIEPLFR